MKRIVLALILACTAVAGIVWNTFAAGGHGEHVPKLPEINGITAEDKFPRACVDCHRNYPERKMDARLSVILKTWTKEVEPKFLEKAQAAMPAGTKLSGKHPNVEGLVKTIPDDCLMCHWRGSEKAPSFSKLLHSIHLVGGKDNHFLTMMGGQCTYCHKLDQNAGAWKIGSGTEDQK